MLPLWHGVRICSCMSAMPITAPAETTSLVARCAVAIADFTRGPNWANRTEVDGFCCMAERLVCATLGPPGPYWEAEAATQHVATGRRYDDIGVSAV